MRRQSDPDSVSDFYAKTVNALDKNTGGTSGTGGGGGKKSDDDEVAKVMSQRLKQAEQKAKDNANAKAPKPDPPSAVVGKGSAQDGVGSERSVAGRKKIGGEGEQEPLKEETEEDHEVETELNSILKKSPIIIFSKSYCPHSKRAKGILLDKYSIDPPPFVVELDQHPIGAKLQAYLAELTGRKTVPNVLVQGVSIGGGDDVAGLDSKNELIDKVKDLGGKKILSMALKTGDEAETAGKGHGLRLR